MNFIHGSINTVNVIVFLIISILMKVIFGIIHFEPGFTCTDFISSIAVTFITALFKNIKVIIYGVED